VNINKSITLRTFKKYQPRQIAKFVRAFFNGRIFIVGLGRLRVIEGKVAAYQSQKNDKNFRVIVSEINRTINELSQPKVSPL
jgi:D-arabinose 5-phosphate isomerase GutQ